MKITSVFFDLDGTLLPQDQDHFIKTYFGALMMKISPLGYDPKKFTEAMWVGIKAMMTNNGGATNEKVFWKVFPEAIGESILEHYGAFEAFYKNDFEPMVRSSCGYDPKAKEAVDKIRALGFRTILATNPVFPSMATEKRIEWAGLLPSDFEYYTTYENSSYSKPNPKYYFEIVEKLGLSPEECLMVGNDTADDMIAESLGMKVFLLTNNLINKDERDISVYERGGFDELISYIEKLK